MQYYDVLKAQFGPIVVSCAISTLVVFPGRQLEFTHCAWRTQGRRGENKK